MSKFSRYIVKADAVARDALGQIKAAKDALEEAERRKKEASGPSTGMSNAERLALAARAEADLQEARLSYDKARRDIPYSTRNQLAEIRKELAEALSTEYSASPGDLDTRTIELLKSGILRSGEYTRLMNDARAAGNATMTRIIGRYAAAAAEEAKKEFGPTDPRVLELRRVAVDTDDDVTAMESKLSAFDLITYVFDRSANNPYMIDNWDELTGRTVENF